MADSRISASKAGYMELIGAKKDGDCRKVDVSAGVSLERGCCNLFYPELRTTKVFSCCTCEYQKPKY
jgi:hypothetical protein